MSGNNDHHEKMARYHEHRADTAHNDDNAAYHRDKAAYHRARQHQKETSKTSLQLPNGPISISAITKFNTYYRSVVATGKDMQIVVMSIKPDDDIGEEIHNNVEQTLFLIEGKAEAYLNNQRYDFNAGQVIVVEPGVKHNIRNIGKTALKICTIYSPPNHLPTTLNRTKEDAENDIGDKAFEKRQNQPRSN